MKVNHFKRSLVSSLALVLGVGCGSATEAEPTAADVDGVPELAAVQMALTEDAEHEGTATDDDTVDPSAIADDIDSIEVPAGAAEDMVAGQRAIRQLNQSLRNFLSPIVELVRTTEPDHSLAALKTWGPVTKGGVTYRLLVRNAAPGRYAWRLEARAEGASSAYERIALGVLVRGDEARRGKGALGVDLDALGKLDDRLVARGKILVGFRHGEAGTTVGYGLRGFTADPELGAGIDAVLRGVHLKTGANRLRLAFHGNLEGSSGDAEELILARLRHLRGVGGRSDVVIVGGDVPDGQTWVRSQCWTKQLQKVFSEMQLCPVEMPIDLSVCQVLETDGDVAACDKSLRDAELPPTDPEAPMEDAKDPNGDVEVPLGLDELADPEMD